MSHILSVWGAGRTGKTTLTMELAKRMSNDGHSVLLVSPMEYSELSFLYDLEIPQSQSLQMAIRSGNLRQAAFKKGDLLYLLASPNQHDLFDDNYSSEQVKEMFSLARTTFDVVLVDCPTEMNNLVAAWGLCLCDKALLCLGGGPKGVMWYRSAGRAIHALQHKAILVGVEMDNTYDFAAMYDAIGTKPKHILPHNRHKSYRKAIEDVVEVSLR